MAYSAHFLPVRQSFRSVIPGSFCVDWFMIWEDVVRIWEGGDRMYMLGLRVVSGLAFMVQHVEDILWIFASACGCMLYMRNDSDYLFSCQNDVHTV